MVTLTAVAAVAVAGVIHNVTALIKDLKTVSVRLSASFTFATLFH